MAEIIKPIFVNISIIVSLTFIANQIYPFNAKVGISLKQKLFFGVISSLAAIGCMYYPIDGFRTTVFDLRTVPLIVVTLYAGLIPGLMCSLVIIFTRLSIGGEYAWVGVLITVVALVIGFAYSRMFNEALKKWKPGLVAGFLFFLLYILILHIHVDFLPVRFYFIYFFSFYTLYFLLILLIDRLIRINLQLEETIYLGKLSVLGQMAASIAHEIRNPLTTVRGMIQFLSRHTKDDQLKQHAPLIIDELDRSNKIISDYLSLVKPSEMKLQTVDLNEIVEDITHLLSPLAVFNSVVIKPELSKSHLVKVDEHQLKQCLINLIKNGIEAIEGNGTIYIRDEVNVADAVDLVIEDTGKGMTKEEVQKIGLPFYTTKTKGTGLGTMITFRLIKNMKGSIYYTSTRDKGTSVIVRLPVSTNEEEE
ncbi:ATP-binding protein [Pseudalkalibacillus salsuginis]|uniref:ATP-binding protein n=1 Tax=Pseudalkalibacillus salsuginis TaxID=2910972 RepID=UPI001F186CE6|nr:ATP-binding protein [Pseudalkalibacillus salsuginis]MCF6411067.1 ATP-binding protein [Pseudalkalibacillus salsuginis]